MLEFFKFILSSFWVFLGFVIIMGLPLNILFRCWNRYWRHKNILKHGYPIGTDADGDFPETDKDEN